MVVLIILGYLVVGGVEMLLWSKRTTKNVVTYWALLVVVAAFSVLLTFKPDLPLPSPFMWLLSHLKNIWQGGGR